MREEETMVNLEDKGTGRCAAEGNASTTAARGANRAQRIAELAKQVRSGTYRPSPRKIIEALLRKEPDLFRIP